MSTRQRLISLLILLQLFLGCAATPPTNDESGGVNITMLGAKAPATMKTATLIKIKNNYFNFSNLIKNDLATVGITIISSNNNSKPDFIIEVLVDIIPNIMMVGSSISSLKIYFFNPSNNTLIAYGQWRAPRTLIDKQDKERILKELLDDMLYTIRK